MQITYQNPYLALFSLFLTLMPSNHIQTRATLLALLMNFSLSISLLFLLFSFQHVVENMLAIVRLLTLHPNPEPDSTIEIFYA